MVTKTLLAHSVTGQADLPKSVLPVRRVSKAVQRELSKPLPPAYLAIARHDFITLLRNERVRSEFQHGTDRRLAIDLRDLGGMAAAW